MDRQSWVEPEERAPMEETLGREGRRELHRVVVRRRLDQIAESLERLTELLEAAS